MVAAGSLEGVRMIDNPMAVVDAPVEVAKARERADDEGLRDRRVLVAEDNPTNRVLVMGMLKKARMRATAVEKGKFAADTALGARDRFEPLGLILMDVQMPVIGGHEATGLLRQKGYTGPTVALTAHAM
jgi:CheY-like chemotaxis protein